MTDKNKKTAAVETPDAAKTLLKGTVVFYNKDKGFGFVRTADDKDYHFGHRAFGGTTIPAAGDLVEFTVSSRPPKPGKSPNVEHLEIVGKDAELKDGKETCPHCGKRVVPRMTTFRCSPFASYCPLCGGMVKMFYQEDDRTTTRDWIARFIWLFIIGCWVYMILGVIWLAITE